MNPVLERWRKIDEIRVQVAAAQRRTAALTARGDEQDRQIEALKRGVNDLERRADRGAPGRLLDPAGLARAD